MGFVAYLSIGVLLLFLFIFLRKVYEKHNRPKFMSQFKNWCEYDLTCFGVVIIISQILILALLWPLIIGFAAMAAFIVGGIVGVLWLFKYVINGLEKLSDKILKK